MHYRQFPVRNGDNLGYWRKNHVTKWRASPIFKSAFYDDTINFVDFIAIDSVSASRINLTGIQRDDNTGKRGKIAYKGKGAGKKVTDKEDVCTLLILRIP